MFLSIGMLKLNYFLADIFILSAEKQPIKLSWRKIEWLRNIEFVKFINSILFIVLIMYILQILSNIYIA